MTSLFEVLVDQKQSLTHLFIHAVPDLHVLDILVTGLNFLRAAADIQPHVWPWNTLGTAGLQFYDCRVYHDIVMDSRGSYILAATLHLFLAKWGTKYSD